MLTVIRFKRKITTYLEPELIQAIDVIRTEKFNGISRAEAIRLAVRQWVLVQRHSYLWGKNKRAPGVSGDLTGTGPAAAVERGREE